MMGYLSGKKTYIISAIMAIMAFMGYEPSAEVNGLLEMGRDYIMSPQMKLLLEALGLGFLRAGVAKK